MANHTRKWQYSSTSPTYNSWKAMRNRCLHDNNNSSYYKKIGITICEEWVNNFDAFVKDMGERPEGTTLDRIDPKGNYEPSNCRWATWRMQENNKSCGLTSIEYQGETKTIGEWAYLLDLSPRELARAYKRHSKYNATTFEELFYEGRLLGKRIAERENQCLICGSTSTCKWRKFGALCNTCYGKARKVALKEGYSIEDTPDWAGINWPTTYGHL